jgi:hypothetical protein
MGEKEAEPDDSIPMVYATMGSFVLQFSFAKYLKLEEMIQKDKFTRANCKVAK